MLSRQERETVAGDLTKNNIALLVTICQNDGVLRFRESRRHLNPTIEDGGLKQLRDSVIQEMQAMH